MKPKLLLQACCGPCSSAIIEHLSNYYDLTLYYYNPCITEPEEYFKRANELKKLVSEMELSNVTVVIEPYNPVDFYVLSNGLENEPEGGVRCKACYAQRLQKTAEYARDNGFTEFSTTLTISPYKNSAVINDIGTKIGQSTGVMYLCFDFGFLYTRSLELCKQYNLYEQTFCGCVYSQYNNENLSKGN